jgi:hypothetical protein
MAVFWVKPTSRHRKTNVLWYHIYVQSEKVEFIEVDSRIIVTQVGKGGQTGKGTILVRWYNVSLRRNKI